MSVFQLDDLKKNKEEASNQKSETFTPPLTPLYFRKYFLKRNFFFPRNYYQIGLQSDKLLA